jgi:hypothetical protein
VTVSIVAYEIGFLFSYDISISPGFYCLFSLLLSIFFFEAGTHYVAPDFQNVRMSTIGSVKLDGSLKIIVVA